MQIVWRSDNLLNSAWKQFSGRIKIINGKRGKTDKKSEPYWKKKLFQINILQDFSGPFDPFWTTLIIIFLESWKN